MSTKALTKFWGLGRNYCYYTTFQPVQTKRGVTQVFKSFPNHSLCDLHTILNEHTSIISIQEPSKRKIIIFVYFFLFLSVDFVNILPKSGGEQTLIGLNPPPPPPPPPILAVCCISDLIDLKNTARAWTLILSSSWYYCYSDPVSAMICDFKPWSKKVLIGTHLAESRRSFIWNRSFTCNDFSL